ncbi:hypothetical protein K420107F6_39830 [Lactonifactor longoviformis]
MPIDNISSLLVRTTAGDLPQQSANDKDVVKIQPLDNPTAENNRHLRFTVYIYTTRNATRIKKAPILRYF